MSAAAVRPTVTVYNTELQKGASIPLPAVFTAPIRRDVVQFVHTNIAKNRRQAYAVAYASGEQTSAMSWGTGRAVARIPRVGGGGTGRSGQGAFGNMCRKGRMFAPTKIWRRWHRHVNVRQRRYAIASAIAATAVPALVMARGHKIEQVEEIPFVVSNLTSIKKTKDALAFLKKAGVNAEVERVVSSKKIRAGKGKWRNRRYVQRKGPLVIHNAGRELERAFRNIPGVELVHIDRLNLLKLAPGGHLGRFCIWEQAAFSKLESLFGTTVKGSSSKRDFTLPRAPMVNADLARLINSTEVQAVVRPAVRERRLTRQKKNPLRNFKALVRLNPYAAVIRKQETEAAAAKKAAKAKAGPKGTAVPKAKKDRTTRYNKKRRAVSKAVYQAITSEEFKRPADFIKA